MTMTPATYSPPSVGDFTGQPVRRHLCQPCTSSTFLLSAVGYDDVTTPGDTTAGTQQDLTTETQTSASYRTAFRISCDQVAPGLPPKPVTFEVTDGTAATSPVDGGSVSLKDGEVYFVARAEDGEISAVKAATSVTPSGSATFRTGFVEGSARKNALDEIVSRTQGRGRDCLPVWSTRDVATKTFIWNTDCWAADIENKTCISPYNTATGGGCVLVSPRHMISCHHLSYYPKPGAKIYLVRPDNVTDEYTVDSVVEHPYASGTITSPWDVVAIKLDRDVHPSIKFAKVLPQNHRPWFPTGYTNQLYGQNPQVKTQTGEPPTWRACHMTKRFGLALSYIFLLPYEAIPYYTPGVATPWESGRYTHVGHKTGTEDIEFGLIYPENPLGEPIRSGDSGSPAFIVLNGELVVTNVWSSISWGYPFYADTIVNDMLTTLGGGYQLTVADMSGFQVY